MFRAVAQARMVRKWLNSQEVNRCECCHLYSFKFKIIPKIESQFKLQTGWSGCLYLISCPLEQQSDCFLPVTPSQPCRSSTTGSCSVWPSPTATRAPPLSPTVQPTPMESPMAPAEGRRQQRGPAKEQTR